MGLVDLAALVLKALVERFLGGGAVRVPAPIEQLHVPHAALDQPPREQAIVGETLLARLGAVQLVDVLRLLGDVDGVRGRHLHAERHFVLGDAGDRLRIAELLVGPLIDAGDRVDHVAAKLAADARRVGKKQHRLAVRAALHALIHRRQEAGAPQALAAAGKLAAGNQHDEAGQILILAAQPVRRPTADRGVAEVLIARVQQQFGGRVVELVGVHRADEADLVGHFLKVRKPIGNPEPRLADLTKRIDGPQQLRHAADEGEALAFEKLLRAILAVERFQLRLVLEQLELAGRAGQVQINDALRFRGEVPMARRQGLCRIELSRQSGDAAHMIRPNAKHQRRQARPATPSRSAGEWRAR